MEITEKHINIVLTFFAFACCYYFLNNMFFAAVFAAGAWKGISRVNQMKKDWNEESIDPSKIAN